MNTQHLLKIENANYFFIPSGSNFVYTTEEQWTDMVQRNIAICSKFCIIKNNFINLTETANNRHRGHIY